ncbi:hypothetical protein KY284_026267 [Solanum tuberosum]|nr:hypothetical protein KY284_026267 [Solanum tuberosum]
MADFQNWTSNLIGQDTSTQSNPIGEGASTQSIPIGEGDSSGSHARTLVILTTAGLRPSRTCSNFISESFKNELDPNGINWKCVSNDIRNGYFGEFKDSSINEGVLRRQWEVKAATRNV